MSNMGLSLIVLAAAAVGASSDSAMLAIPRATSFVNDTRAYPVDLSIGSYSIRRDGLVRRVGGSDARGQVPLDHDHRIYALFALVVGNDLVVFYEASNELENVGKVVRLDGRTLETKWVASGPGMNITSPVFCADSICLAGHGSVARIVADTGRVVWAHYDLYRALHAFNTPENLVVAKGKLFVHESLASYDHRSPKTLVVDLVSGEYAVK
jgi:outer membrane protein assembly factor BamB